MTVYNDSTPRIKCHNHSGPQLGYVVCIHVLDGAPVEHYQAPKPEESSPERMLGEALCATCAADASLFQPGSNDEELTADEKKFLTARLRLVCSKCYDTFIAGRASDSAWE